LAIIAGVFIATLVNHTLAALAGFYIAFMLGALWFRYLIGVSFIAMAGWALLPDKETGTAQKAWTLGRFFTTLIAFFMVEMGDTTEIAAPARAARFHALAPVVAGTTLGMMLANIPAAYFGGAITRVIPLVLLRYVSAAICLVLGLLGLAETAGFLHG